MRVAFLGNHSVGVEALRSIGDTEQVVAVVAHPADPEDGVRYASVYAYATGRGWPTVRGTAKSPRVLAFLRAAAPDLLWVTDYRYILPPEVLAVPALGAVNLHPSLLPKYRGRASINWAIINGETTTGLTAHFINEGLDTGDIIEQIAIPVAPDENVGDVLEAMYPIYRSLTSTVLRHFRSGAVPRRPQDHGRASLFPARKPDDGIIDFTQAAAAIHNLVRAVAKPYPGAFTAIDGQRLMVWSSKIVEERSLPAEPPGTVIALAGGRPVIQCGTGKIQLSEYEWADPSPTPGLSVGQHLGR